MFVAVIPALNEEKTIEKVVREVSKCVDAVIVVDDGSSDYTIALAEKAGASVLKHEINRGQGAALQTGHEYALLLGADFVLDFDADGQFDPLEITPALDTLQKSNADVLFGSRFLNQKGNMPFTKKYIIHPLAKKVDQIVGAPKLSDVHNGFRIFTREALKKIEITQDRMAHATQIPALVNKQKLSFIEFPVTVRYFEYGQNMRGGFRILKDLIFGKFLP